MYTHDDYLKDVFIRKHGSGLEQQEAEMRCRDYEHGRNPELAPKMRKARNKKRVDIFMPIFLISLLGMLIIGGGYSFPQFRGLIDNFCNFEKTLAILLVTTIISGFFVFDSL